MNYYNEIDPKAAAWLRELIKAGHIPNGDVDERDIRDITPTELSGYAQCHFFAGIGGWSLALKLAGWPADKPVWTGSCPCQPFSAAGKRGGTTDERHLWPHWFHLISQCQPAIVFGEQVASKDGLGWLDLVCADMEATGYAVGAADMCAAGLGAPHIRQRLWFTAERLADTQRGSTERHGHEVGSTARGVQGASWEQRLRPDAGNGIDPVGLGNSNNAGSQGQWQSGNVHAPSERSVEGRHSSSPGMDGGMADANGAGAECGARDDAEAAGFPQGEREPIDGADVPERGGADHDGRGDVRGDGVFCHTARPSPTDGFWRDADWLFCRDGKWRPVEPDTCPLAHGLPARVGRLRGYGNAISPVVGAAFIEAAVESLTELADAD